MRRFSSGIKIIFAIIILAAGAYIVGRTSLSEKIPENFTAARLQGAMISQNIVELSNQLAVDLEKVNQLDQNEDYTEALKLTTEIVKRSQDIRNRAVELSAELEKMTRALPEIDSPRAREAAVESVSSRLALISRLIDYSGYLGQLLDNLRSQFLGLTSRDHEVAALIDKINSEVKAVNDINGEAGAAMERFDKIME